MPNVQIINTKIVSKQENRKLFKLTVLIHTSNFKKFLRKIRLNVTINYKIVYCIYLGHTIILSLDLDCQFLL